MPAKLTSPQTWGKHLWLISTLLVIIKVCCSLGLNTNANNGSLIFQSSHSCLCLPATWCQEMQMESWTFGIGKPPSCTTGSKPMIRFASAPCGTHMKHLRSSLVVGMDRSNFGIKRVPVCLGRRVLGRRAGNGPLETVGNGLSPGFSTFLESHRAGIQSYCSSVFLYPVKYVLV